MANFVTADDKRIYDLVQESSPTLNMFLPIDISGNPSAHRISLQQIINLASVSSPKQDANAGLMNPDNANGSIGDFYFKIPADGSSITMFKKIPGGTFGTWSTVFNLPLADVNGSIKQFPFTDADFVDVDGSLKLPLPFTGGQISLGLISRSEITDGVPGGALINNLSGGQVEGYNGLNGGTQYGIVYYVGESVEEPSIEPNTGIEGMNFGSAAAFQSYLISKGNAGAIVEGYQLSGETELFNVSGISSLAASTFASAPITAFSGFFITGSIGSNCFFGSDIEVLNIPNCTSIGLYSLSNCTSLVAASTVLTSVNQIQPFAFQNSTSLNGGTFNLPNLTPPSGLGGSSGYDSVFDGLSNITIRLPINFSTNNSGGPDGDLISIISNGGTVNYI